MRQLFRLQNVATNRRDRINSDEEERQRKGYELQSVVRFAVVAICAAMPPTLAEPP